MEEVETSSLLQKILNISKIIAGELDYQNVLSRVADEVNQLIPYDHMDIAIILSDGVQSRSYEVGMKTEWSENIKDSFIRLSPIRTVLMGEEPYLLTGNALTDDRMNFEGAYAGPIFDAKLSSRVVVPLIARGGIIGSLNISNHQKNVYNERDLTIAFHLADVLGSHFFAMFKYEEAQKAVLAQSAAISREKILRIGALRLTEGMEKERKRIGMDLHDQTLADLTRIMHYLSRSRQKDSISQINVAFLEDEINTCLNELRNIIEDTKPGVLELFGISQAIEAQLNRSVSGTSPLINTIVIDRSASSLDAADVSVRTTIFRIVQEAINNAVKHSKPNQLTVKICTYESGILIEVIDDGEGFIRNADIFDGGLDNMKVRASLISSSISIDRAEKNKGTKVSLNIPFSTIGIAKTMTGENCEI